MIGIVQVGYASTNPLDWYKRRQLKSIHQADVDPTRAVFAPFLMSQLHSQRLDRRKIHLQKRIHHLATMQCHTRCRHGRCRCSTIPYWRHTVSWLVTRDITHGRRVACRATHTEAIVLLDSLFGLAVFRSGGATQRLA